MNQRWLVYQTNYFCGAIMTIDHVMLGLKLNYQPFLVHQVQHEIEAKIVSIATGAEFSVLLDSKGKVWTFGHPENGTLGHNDDGKFMAKANKVEFRCELSPKQVMVWVEKDTKAKEVTHLPMPFIKKISCG